MYAMVCTRPDLAYPVSVLAQFVGTGRHGDEHWKAAMRALCYLQGTKDHVLTLGGVNMPILQGFNDSSWADAQPDRRSSQGYGFTLGSGLISWRSTRSSSVALSSCEAKLYAVTMTAQEARWLSYLLTDLGSPQPCPTLWCDNDSTIHLTKEAVFHGRSKHIELRYYFVRDLVQDGHITVRKIASSDNLADLFTKALHRSNHFALLRLQGLAPSGVATTLHPLVVIHPSLVVSVCSSLFYCRWSPLPCLSFIISRHLLSAAHPMRCGGLRGATAWHGMMAWQEARLKASMEEHEGDGRALEEWRKFLQRTWQLQSAALEAQEKRLKEEASARRDRLFAAATSHLHLCQVGASQPSKKRLCQIADSPAALPQVDPMASRQPVTKRVEAPNPVEGGFGAAMAPEADVTVTLDDDIEMTDSFDFLGEVSDSFLEKQTTPSCLNSFKIQAINDFKKHFLKYRTLMQQYQFMVDQKNSGIIPHSIHIKPFAFVCNNEEVKQEADKDLMEACTAYCQQAQLVMINMKKAADRALNDAYGVYPKLQSQLANFINLTKNSDLGVKNSKLTDKLNFFKDRIIKDFTESMSQFFLEAAVVETRLKEKKKEDDDKRAAAVTEAENLPVEPAAQLELFWAKAKAVVGTLEGIHEKRAGMVLDGMDAVVADISLRRLHWEERFIAADIQVGGLCHGRHSMLMSATGFGGVGGVPLRCSGVGGAWAGSTAAMRLPSPSHVCWPAFTHALPLSSCNFPPSPPWGSLHPPKAPSAPVRLPWPAIASHGPSRVCATRAMR
ncbi:unnamed protein product [Closterium sp. NIES-54]